jgi:predicted neuraminidase
MWKSVSPNGGLSWTICKPTNIPNPHAALDLVKARSGELLMAFNNSSRDRYSISLALSEDDGKTWSYLLDFDGGEGEYSYPCLIQDKSGRFHVTYTQDRYRIKHLEFDLDWLKKEPLGKPIETD